MDGKFNREGARAQSQTLRPGVLAVKPSAVENAMLLYETNITDSRGSAMVLQHTA